MHLCTRLIFSLIIFYSVANPKAVIADDLNIQPIAQQTPVWCWAAVSEMALRHYNVPTVNPAGNFQCGVVAMLGGACNADCRLCVTGIGSTFNLKQVLDTYTQIVQRSDIRPRVAGRLSFDDIMDEIDEGDPVIAGISPTGFGEFYPPGFGEHVVLIVGYEEHGGSEWLRVNDPYPYGFNFGPDPFLSAGGEASGPGAYWIRYADFVSSLDYKDTVYFQ